MKSKSYLTYLSILMLCVACKTPHDNDPETSLIRGSFFDVFLEDTLKIQPNSIIIDGNLVTLNEQLEFNVDLYPGEYSLQVVSDDHFPLDTMITISETDSLLDVELKPIMLDYYSTKVGDKWEFSFSHTSLYSGGDPERNYYKGEMTWEIVSDSFSTDTQDSIFVVEQILKGQKIDVSFGDTVSNTYVEEKYTFNIYVEPEGFIRYSNISYFNASWNGFGYGYYLLSKNGTKDEYYSFQGHQRLWRYLPKSRTQGKDISVATSTEGRSYITISKTKGLVNSIYNYSGNSHGGFSATLTNFTSN